MDSDRLLEALAELEHEQWKHWAKAIAGEVSEDRKRRWEGWFVAYQDLPESAKEDDRIWARKVLQILSRFGMTPEQLPEQP